MGAGDLSFTQGSTFVQVFTNWSDANGVPYDLSNFTGSADARIAYSDPTASFSFSVAILSPAVSGSGSFALSLTSAQSATISGGLYIYDVKMVNGPSVTYPVAGTVTVIPRVTH
jgi:hypothetical protein